MNSTAMSSLRAAFRMVASTACRLANALSARVTYLETKMRDLCIEVQALKIALATFDKELANVHQFCDDLVEGRWELEDLFPNTSQKNSEHNQPAKNGGDSSAVFYAPSHSYKMNRDSGSDCGFQVC